MYRLAFPSMSRYSQAFTDIHRFFQSVTGMYSYPQVLTSTIKEGVPLHQVCYHCLRDLDSREASDARSSTGDTESDVASSQHSTRHHRFCSNECRYLAYVRYHLKVVMRSKLHELCVPALMCLGAPCHILGCAGHLPLYRNLLRVVSIPPPLSVRSVGMSMR